VAGHCNASQDAQDAWDAGDASLASGRNADGSDAGSVFADEGHALPSRLTPFMTPKRADSIEAFLTLADCNEAVPDSSGLQLGPARLERTSASAR